MNRCPSKLDHLFLVANVIFGLTYSTIVSADTTISITDIGTSITDKVAIHTHVDTVTHSNPTDVVLDGLPAVEIRGTVTGVGWGGSGLVTRAADAHYRYDIPFVARWRRGCTCQRLVFYNHGGGLNLIGAVLREKQVGAANSNRTAELNGDLLVGIPALLDQSAYISINRRGLRGDGTFSATYLPPTPPLDAAEVMQLENKLGGFQQPGISVGSPVPLVLTNDAATFRDVARALERVVASLIQKPFCTRIGVGSSSGARLFAALDFGRSVIGNQSVRTGGNHVSPYDIGSARIFDGFILSGFPYAPGVEQADDAIPLSGPTFFVQGQGDERYQQHVTMAHELMQRGVVLDGRIWIYEIKNLTHVTRDNVVETTNPSNGDRLGCFMSAAVRNLRRLLEHRVPPPRSRMAGRIVAGELRFDLADGSTTNIAPIPINPTLDTFLADTTLTPQIIGCAETRRWLAVSSALSHECEAITPPTVACRLGGYKLMFFGSQLVPFSPSELRTKYGSFENYRAGLCRTVTNLETQCLYDQRVESGHTTAEPARAFFD